MDVEEKTKEVVLCTGRVKNKVDEMLEYIIRTSKGNSRMLIEFKKLDKDVTDLKIAVDDLKGGS